MTSFEHPVNEDPEHSGNVCDSYQNNAAAIGDAEPPIGRSNNLHRLNSGRIYNRRLHNKWLKLYTLIHNPSLIQTTNTK